MAGNHIAARRRDTSAHRAAKRSFGFLVHDVSRLLEHRFERAARHTGLPITRRQAAALLYIACSEGVSQTAVATWLDIEPIALVRMLDKLHEEGWSNAAPIRPGRRVRAVWLKPAAQPVVERILESQSPATGNIAGIDEIFAGTAIGQRSSRSAAGPHVWCRFHKRKHGIGERRSEPTPITTERRTRSSTARLSTRNPRR